MKTKSRLFKSIVSLMCALVIIAFSTLIIVEHSHDCLNTDCIICDSINESKNILTANTNIKIKDALKFESSFICVLTDILFNNNDTLVNLKVKLSL